MKTMFEALAFAAALVVGGAALAPAEAAVAGGQAAGVAQALDTGVAQARVVCGPRGCVRTYPRRGWNAGPRFYGPRPHMRRCTWRVRPTPWGPRRERVCW